MYSIRGVEGKEPLQNLRIAELASLSKNGKIYIFDRTGLQFPNGPYKERVEDLFSTKYFIDKTDNFRNSWIDGHGKDNKLFDKRFKEMRFDLSLRVNQIMGGLQSMGLNAMELDTQSLIELYYTVYNPELTQSQPLTAIESLQVEA
jgi:hypothetical protein